MIKLIFYLKSLLPEEFGKKQDKQLLILIGFIVIAISLIPTIKYRDFPDFRLFIFGILAIILGYIFPVLIRPITVIWFALGGILHKITNPIILGLVFFFFITPYGLIKRLFNSPKNSNPETYWIERTPPSPKPESIKFQF